MMTLYQFPTSPFCEKVRRVLNYKRVGFRIVDVPRQDMPSLADVAPVGKLPALRHDDAVIWDSTDIVLHLERHFPDPPLLPVDPADAALVHVFEDWADESLYFYEVTMRLSWEHNARRSAAAFSAGSMGGMPLGRITAALVEGSSRATKAQGLGRKPREQIVADVARHFRALDGRLGRADWLVGDAPTLADIAVAPQVGAMLETEEGAAEAAGMPGIAMWLARLDAVAPA